MQPQMPTPPLRPSPPSASPDVARLACEMKRTADALEAILRQLQQAGGLEHILQRMEAAPHKECSHQQD